MTDDRNVVTFYVPLPKEMHGSIPQRSEDYWPWMLANRGLGDGRYAWTLQTVLFLREAGFPCEMTDRFPPRGIVVSHRDFLPVFQLPRQDVFLVCVKADRKEHTWASHYIVQNGRDAFLTSRKGRNRATVVPHWPQPSLIPRNVDRGVQCRRVAYFGRALNLAAELRTPEWDQALEALGLEWSVVGQENWNDYSSVDVTVSVRSFAGKSVADPVMNPDSKPPTKLMDSWLARVPAIVGRDERIRAYDKARWLHRSDDSAGAQSRTDRAQDQRRLYRRMVEQAVNGGGSTTEAVCAAWQRIDDRHCRAFGYGRAGFVCRGRWKA